MTDRQTHQIALALGSNLGDRVAALRAARASLESIVNVKAASLVYETQAAYVEDQPPFLNAALLAETDMEPMALLKSIKQIEQIVGRTPTFRYGPRVIDIDIVFYGSLRMSANNLTIPHPHMAERAFVLRPLADIAAGWRHPVSGLTICDMLAALPDDGGLRLADEQW